MTYRATGSEDGEHRW